VTLLNELLPVGIRGVVLAALVASLISSNLSVMNSISTLAVRDFVMHFRPATTDRTQVFIGRVAIVLATVLGAIAAYLVYTTPDGLYKYLQTISIYLVMPITPAIVFGILSKRVTVTGAITSVVTGVLLASLFVTDQLIGAQRGAALFPWLHQKLTLNYTYRGLWGTLLITVILVLVSAFTRKSPPEKISHLTIDWHMQPEPFRGLADWRLQLGILSLATIGLYAWLW